MKVVESKGENHVFHLFNPTCDNAVDLMKRVVAFLKRGQEIERSAYGNLLSDLLIYPVIFAETCDDCCCLCCPVINSLNFGLISLSLLLSIIITSKNTLGRANSENELAEDLIPQHQTDYRSIVTDIR